MLSNYIFAIHFSSAQSLSCVQLFVNPWITANQTSLSITNSWSSLRFTSIKSVMPSSHLILCCPLLLLPPIPPSIRVFFNETDTQCISNITDRSFQVWSHNIPQNSIDTMGCWISWISSKKNKLKFFLLCIFFPLNNYLQFSSVAQSCPTLCDTINRSMPGLPVHHQVLEFTQTHVHRFGDAIQPSHPLSSLSSPAPNPSQHQSLFQWVSSSHEVAKVLEFQL